MSSVTWLPNLLHTPQDSYVQPRLLNQHPTVRVAYKIVCEASCHHQGSTFTLSRTNKQTINIRTYTTGQLLRQIFLLYVDRMNIVSPDIRFCFTRNQILISRYQILFSQISDFAFSSHIRHIVQSCKQHLPRPQPQVFKVLAMAG